MVNIDEAPVGYVATSAENVKYSNVCLACDFCKITNGNEADTDCDYPDNMSFSCLPTLRIDNSSVVFIKKKVFNTQKETNLPTLTTKGIDMSKYDVSLFNQLAGGAVRDEFDEAIASTLPQQLRDALAAKQKKENEEVVTEAAETIFALLKEAKGMKETCISSIRVARDIEREAKKDLTYLEDCIAYASETQNYHPLLAALEKPHNLEMIPQFLAWRLKKDVKASNEKRVAGKAVKASLARGVTNSVTTRSKK